MTAPVIGFFEDWDGEMVLSDIRNYKDEHEFLEQAEKYVTETRGYRVPVLQPSVMDIVFNDEEWKPADDPDFKGEKITVYVSDLDYENAETEVNKR